MDVDFFKKKQKHRNKIDSLLKTDQKEVKKASTSHYSMFYFHSITKQMRKQSQLSEKHKPSDVQSANEGPFI